MKLDDICRRVESRVRRIPVGRVQTYGDIYPQSPRNVGRALRYLGESVPWHRVVRADGSLAIGERQRERLREEGVPMKGDRVDLPVARIFGHGRRSAPK